ncbi:MAG: S8 family serine peptidase [Candidatus Wallbacteria bacterium]|nr:S8 family serine peptidase [Candidatus Wallbacteria bacterium]
MKLSVILILLFSFVIYAADTAEIRIGVLDSGTDFTHDLLKRVIDKHNPEFTGQKDVDDDKNSYVDDIFGWNFNDNSSQLVDLALAPANYDEILHFMEIYCKFQEVGMAGLGADDQKYLKEKAEDDAFMAKVTSTAEWAHGTHVGGITAGESSPVVIRGISQAGLGASALIDIDEAVGQVCFAVSSNSRGNGRAEWRGIQDNPNFKEIVAELEKVGQSKAEKMIAEGKYLAGQGMKIVNCSWGSDFVSLFKTVQQMMPQLGYEKATTAEVIEMTNLFVEKALLPSGAELFKNLNGSLIVIAAGNTPFNTDNYKSLPVDVAEGCKLVVAATNGDKSLANFSTWGPKKVDVAVPGVNVLSSYPGGKMGRMSGTSQAAPLAVRYASVVLATNPSLTAEKLKEVILSTVDKKPWLEGKVRSGGMINVKRAASAARAMSEGAGLEEAVTKAFQAVPESKAFRGGEQLRFGSEFEKELYFKIVF